MYPNISIHCSKRSATCKSIQSSLYCVLLAWPLGVGLSQFLNQKMLLNVFFKVLGILWGDMREKSIESSRGCSSCSWRARPYQEQPCLPCVSRFPFLFVRKWLSKNKSVWSCREEPLLYEIRNGSHWDASCMLRYYLSGFQMGFDLDLSGCWPTGYYLV